MITPAFFATKHDAVGIDGVTVSFDGLVRVVEWYDYDRYLPPKVSAHLRRLTHSSQ